MKAVEDISEIEIGRRYALIVGDYLVRELTGGSFGHRKASLVQVWIDSRILYDITPVDYHEPKVTVRK